MNFIEILVYPNCFYSIDTDKILSFFQTELLIFGMFWTPKLTTFDRYAH